MIKKEKMADFLKEIDHLLQATKKREVFNIENDLKELFDGILADKDLAPDITEVILYIISELADNIKEHSQADSWQTIFSKNDKEILIFIFDNGIGIPALFSKYFPKDKGSEWDKVLEAIEKGVSTKGEGRGFGLKTTKGLVGYLNGKMIFISGGNGYLITKDKKEKIKIPKGGTIILIKFPARAKIEKSKFYKIIEDKK